MWDRVLRLISVKSRCTKYSAQPLLRAHGAAAGALLLAFARPRDPQLAPSTFPHHSTPVTHHRRSSTISHHHHHRRASHHTQTLQTSRLIHPSRSASAIHLPIERLRTRSLSHYTNTTYSMQTYQFAIGRGPQRRPPSPPPAQPPAPVGRGRSVASFIRRQCRSPPQQAGRSERGCL